MAQANDLAPLALAEALVEERIAAPEKAGGEGPQVGKEGISMSTPEPPPDYSIRLRPLHDSAPAAIRLRHLLKYALRGLGLRCISIKEVPRDNKPAPPDNAGERE